MATIPNDGAVVLLSGGIDSTTVLAEAYRKYGSQKVFAISFDYGQKHRIELDQAREIAMWYNVPWSLLKLPQIFAGAGSTLVDDDAPVEHVGTYAELAERFGSQPTVVPNRNMVLLSLAVTYAITHHVGRVMIGAHAGDAANYHYPDCRPAFNGAMSAAIEIATEGAIELVAPFNFASKGQLIQRAAFLKIPAHLTQSCYNGARPACGTCATCHERIAAFVDAGYRDPIAYVNGTELYHKMGVNPDSLKPWPVTELVRNVRELVN